MSKNNQLALPAHFKRVTCFPERAQAFFAQIDEVLQKTPEGFAKAMLGLTQDHSLNRLQRTF